MEKSNKNLPRVLIIVGLCLLVVALLGTLLYYAFIGCIFNVKHTTVFENKTYACKNLPLQFSPNATLEQFSFSLKEIDEQTAAAQNYANTIKNYVDGKFFAVELRLKFVGYEQAEVYTFNQVKIGPEPIRPDRYFFTVDLSSKGLGKTTWRAEFDKVALIDKSVEMMCYDYHSNQFVLE